MKAISSTHHNPHEVDADKHGRRESAAEITKIDYEPDHDDYSVFQKADLEAHHAVMDRSAAWGRSMDYDEEVEGSLDAWKNRRANFVGSVVGSRDAGPEAKVTHELHRLDKPLGVAPQAIGR